MSPDFRGPLIRVLIEDGHKQPGWNVSGDFEPIACVGVHLAIDVRTVLKLRKPRFWREQADIVECHMNCAHPLKFNPRLQPYE